ncbi:MAG TPA: aldo/keto reductase [Thermoanaerobaculia bacterium]|nr:aldo/keto reductase [Thermoanaerobaculia bacterium]
MRTIRLGRTNVNVPAVSLGTWGHGGPNKSGDVPVGWTGHDDGLASEALRLAWRRGITHWDTADVYGDGNAEELIGGVWDEVPRDQIFLATKVGWNAGSYEHFYHPDLIRKRADRSLQKLRTDVIDLHYFHHCDFGPDDVYLDDAIGTFHQLRSEGKIRFIGLSDWDNSKVARLAPRIDPDVVQPFRNVIDDTYESSGLKAWVESSDSGVAFFSPLKHGLLLGKYDKPAVFGDGDFRSRIPEFGDQVALDRLRRRKEKIEERFRDRPEPLLHALLGVLLEDSPTGCVLLGQRNPEQVEAAAVAGELLSSDDAEFVRGVYRS